MKHILTYIKESSQNEIYDEHFTKEQNEIINKIAKGGYVELSDKTWMEEMDLSERELMLMVSGFTGLIDENELEEFGTLYFPISREDLFNEMQDQLVNEFTGYGMDDSYVYTFGYANGDIKRVSHDENDIELKKPVTQKMSWRTAWTIIKNSLNLRNLVFILRTDGYEEPNYWVKNDAGLQLLKKYGEFEEWKNGRGEKRRDYIQDDWI